MPKVVFGKTGRKVPIARQFETARYRFRHGYNTMYIESFPEYKASIKKNFYACRVFIKKKSSDYFVKTNN